MPRGRQHRGSRGAVRGLLEEALAVAGERLATESILDALPAGAFPSGDDPVQMRLFVHGPLAEAVATAMGRASADRLVDHYELTRGLAEEAEAHEPNTGAVAIISPSYSLRDRLENLLDVEGFLTFSGGDTAEAIALCKAEPIALVLIDEDAPEPLYDDPYRAMRSALGSRMPATVLLVGEREARAHTCPVVSKVLDPIELLEVVHALASPGSPESAAPQGSSRRDSTPSQRWAGQSPYAPLVYEALELVAAPEMRDRLVREALTAAQMETVPSDRTLFAQFVNDALYHVIARALGEEDADAVVLDLQSTSGIFQRAAIMANKQPSSIPPSEAQALEETAEDDEPSGIHRPGLSISEAPTALATDPHDAKSDPSRSETPARRPSPMPDDSPSHVRSKPIKVLLADDDETLLGMLERTLDAAGFEVATATNGRDALSLCLRYEPTVLVADMHMPVLNGRDVAQLLKRMRENRAPATILLTADPTVPRLIEDVAEVLGKPIRARHLIDAIERAAGTASEHVV